MRIVAECAACAWIYDACEGLSCPHCRGTGVRWVSQEPDPYAIIDVLRAKQIAFSNQVAEEFPPSADIAELEALWLLTDNRG